MTRPRRIGYPHIVSTIALVVALLGSGVAVAGSGPDLLAKKLPKNSVTTKQIKNGSVRGEDLAAGAVGSGQVADGSLTGADIDEGTLGKVPSAAAVDTVRHFSITPTGSTPVVLVTHGALTLSAKCSGIIGSDSAELHLSTSVNQSSWRTNVDGEGTSNFSVADGSVTVFSDGAGPGITVGEVFAGGGDGSTLHAYASLIGGISSCHLEVDVVG